MKVNHEECQEKKRQAVHPNSVFTQTRSVILDRLFLIFFFLVQIRNQHFQKSLITKCQVYQK